MATHPVGFFDTDILGQHKMKANKTLASCLTRTDIVETYQSITMLREQEIISSSLNKPAPPTVSPDYQQLRCDEK